MSQDVARIGRDPDAFEAFYREHVDAIQRFVARRVADPYLAADLTADVFLAAIDSAHRYRPGRGSPIGWLYGVAHNIVASERRRQARELKAHQRAAGTRVLTEDDIAKIEDRIDAESTARDLYVAMEQLSRGERAVLSLVALDGLTAQDAARALGIRPVTARVRLHRARATLRTELSSVTVNPEVAR